LQQAMSLVPTALGPASAALAADAGAASGRTPEFPANLSSNATISADLKILSKYTRHSAQHPTRRFAGLRQCVICGTGVVAKPTPSADRCEWDYDTALKIH
jgi:hypothetical protein